MIVYSATRSEFTNDVYSNVIETKILEAFRLRLGHSTSRNEIESAACITSPSREPPNSCSRIGCWTAATSSGDAPCETSHSLTTTAERSQMLAGSVAAASEQASANVQSVASATEEMASSITEISRQVQESARIAVEAVDEAGGWLYYAASPKNATGTLASSMPSVVPTTTAASAA